MKLTYLYLVRNISECSLLITFICIYFDLYIHYSSLSRSAVSGRRQRAGGGLHEGGGVVDHDVERERAGGRARLRGGAARARSPAAREY